MTTIGGHPLTHPLGETFYSQVPFRHGDYVAKIALAPVSPALKSLKNAPVPLHGRPNRLREAVIDFFRTDGTEWELCVQLRTNEATMPIEDASAEWPEGESPYLPVARVAVPPSPPRVRRAPGKWTTAWPSPPGTASRRTARSVPSTAPGWKPTWRAPGSGRSKTAARSTNHGRGWPRRATRRRFTALPPAGKANHPGTPDARPGAGAWTQPMRPTAWFFLAGGAVAGLALSAAPLRVAAKRSRAFARRSR